MIVLNRIGNKLGVAGLVGVLLAAGMAASQMTAEVSVNQANQRADSQKSILDEAVQANLMIYRMQISVRDIRLTKTAEGIEKSIGALREAKLLLDQHLNATIERVVLAANKERLQKIKSLSDLYAGNAEKIAQLQGKVFDLVKNRNVQSAQWSKSFNELIASPALLSAPNGLDIEKTLFEADTSFNAIRAAVWRLGATGEEGQRQIISQRMVLLENAIIRAKGLWNDSKYVGVIESMATVIKAFTAINNEVVQIEAAKVELVATGTLPMATEALNLLRTVMDLAEKLSAEAKADAAAALAQANSRGLILVAVLMLSLIGSVIFTFMGVARPLTRLNGALGKMAAGALDIDIPGASRGDEVGDIAKTVVVIRQNAEQKAHDEAESNTLRDRAASEQRKADMYRLADDFEGAVGDIVENVSSASTELEASAGTLTSTAERAQQLTIVVAAASEEASTNVQSVASAAEEMASSVNEISRQVQESARIAQEAVFQAETTNARIAELAQAATRIGDVVELINTIAGQTNLLALNATIEAARAGEAGRGFAVVASEVKALAEQTAKATGEISQQISGMQFATEASVGAIRDIGTTIAKMSEISSTIASAVEEQGAATREISRNVQQAAQGTLQVSSNIGDVQRGAGETGTASSQVLSAAQSLSGESNRLKLEVGKFLNTVRAA